MVAEKITRERCAMSLCASPGAADREFTSTKQPPWGATCQVLSAPPGVPAQSHPPPVHLRPPHSPLAAALGEEGHTQITPGAERSSRTPGPGSRCAYRPRAPRLDRVGTGPRAGAMPPGSDYRYRREYP